MSLESSIDALTAAVKENTDTLKGAMTGKASTTASAKDETKDTGTTTRTTRSRSTKADKAPSTADLKKAAESFLDKAGNDEDNYADRRAHIKKVIAKFDSPKFTEIAEDDRKAALEMLADFDKDDGDNGGSSREEDNDI